MVSRFFLLIPAQNFQGEKLNSTRMEFLVPRDCDSLFLQFAILFFKCGYTVLHYYYAIVCVSCRSVMLCKEKGGLQ